MALNPNYTVTIKQTVDPQNPGTPGIIVTASLPETMGFDTSSEYGTPLAQGLFSGGILAKSDSALFRAIGQAAGAAAAASGTRLTTQAMTAQIWQGSSESDLMLDLDFQTETDPNRDVRIPILNLLKLSTASIDPATGMLKSPGPRVDLTDTGNIGVAGGVQAANSVKQVGGAIGQIAATVKQGVMNGPNANLNGGQQGNTPPKTDAGLGGSQYWKSVIRNQISIQIGNYAFFDSVVIKNVQKTYSNIIDARTGLPLHAKVSIRFCPLFLLVQQDLDNIFAIRGGQ